MHVDFLHLPISLTRVFSTEDLGDYCLSAHHTADGNILLGCGDGIKLFNTHEVSITAYERHFEYVSTALEYQNSIYVLHKKEDLCKVEMCLPDLSASLTLFEFVNASRLAAKMAVSEKHVVVWNPADGKLIIFNRAAKKQATDQYARTNNPYFLPDGHLLALGENALVKYCLEEGVLAEKWTCSGIENACGIFSDGKELIYVCAWKLVYLVSLSGKTNIFLLYFQIISLWQIMMVIKVGRLAYTEPCELFTNYFRTWQLEQAGRINLNTKLLKLALYKKNTEPNSLHKISQTEPTL